MGVVGIVKLYYVVLQGEIEWTFQFLFIFYLLVSQWEFPWGGSRFKLFFTKNLQFSKNGSTKSRKFYQL